MPRKQTDPALRDLTLAAADKLDELGEPGFARVVREYVEVFRSTGPTGPTGTTGRTPSGRRRKEWQPDPKVTLPMWTFKSVWDRAEQRADAEERTRADAIEDGFTAFLAGEFVPVKAVRGAGPGGEQRKTLNSRISEARAREIAEFVAAHAEEFGWSPSPGQVAAAWLEQEYAPAPQE